MPITRHSLARIALLLALALVSVFMVVPYPALDLLRSENPSIDEAANLLLSIVPGVDLGHVVAFGALGVLVKISYPRLPARSAAAVLVAVATVLELLQVWSPGRDPEVIHALLDVIGGLSGFGFAYAVGTALRPENTGARR